MMERRRGEWVVEGLCRRYNPSFFIHWGARRIVLGGVGFGISFPEAFLRGVAVDSEELGHFAECLLDGGERGAEVFLGGGESGEYGSMIGHR